MFGVLLIPAAIIVTAIILDEPPVELPVEKIILLPGEDGQVGAVTVSSAEGEQTIDTAYASVDVTASGALSSGSESAAAVQGQYGGLLDAAPPPPQSYTVYFVSGSADTLTAVSLDKFDEIRRELATRPAPEISVIGHTDTVGGGEDNDDLSKERASSVKGMIEAAGISAKSIEASGRGERELLVTTADNVDEPRNRRVEITIR